MATTARFQKAVTNARPFKSHRYDVYGLKLNRLLTIFGRMQLDAWLLLEANPNILQYCERPLYIPDHKPKRIVDFWASYRDHDEIWLVESEDTLITHSEGAAVAVQPWAEQHKCKIRQVVIRASDRTYLNNWGTIVRDLSANRRYLDPHLIAAVRECLDRPRPLSGLCALLHNHDPILVRSAAYSLMHAGDIRCSELALEPLGPTSVVELK